MNSSNCKYLPIYIIRINLHDNKEKIKDFYLFSSPIKEILEKLGYEVDVLNADYNHILKKTCDKKLSEITYFSVDQVYNRESPKTISFKVDNEPPVNPKVTSAGCWAPDRLPQGKCSDPAFTWAGAYDAGMGLATVDPYEVYWGSNPNATSGSRMSATQLDPPPVPTNTPMYLRLRTLDRQGLWSSWQTLYTFIYNPKVQHYLFFTSAFNR